MAGVISITLWPMAHEILHREQGQGRGGRESRGEGGHRPSPSQRDRGTVAHLIYERVNVRFDIMSVLTYIVWYSESTHKPLVWLHGEI